MLARLAWVPRREQPGARHKKGRPDRPMVNIAFPARKGEWTGDHTAEGASQGCGKGRHPFERGIAWAADPAVSESKVRRDERLAGKQAYSLPTRACNCLSCTDFGRPLSFPAKAAEPPHSAVIAETGGENLRSMYAKRGS